MMDERPHREVVKPKENKDIGRKGPIGLEQIQSASKRLNEYISYKSAFDDRFIENQKWYMQRHWGVVKGQSGGNKTDPEPTSAYLFNAIANKHADAMDNYPEPAVLPRAMDDKEVATTLSSILPCVMEQCDFQEVYSDNWYDKLISGCGLYGVFWDNNLYSGLGDVAITKCELLNFFCEPNIEDIQKSKDVFYVDLLEKEVVEELYPFLKDEIKSTALGLKEYEKDSNKSDSDKVAVIDWYYKKNGKVHLVKYCGDNVIYATENDPNKRNTGMYIHGKYPFVLDPCFPLKGTPFGFGVVDVAKNSQLYIDKLNQVILKNALVNSRPRFLASKESGINDKDLQDLTKDVVFANNLRENHIMPIMASELSGGSLSMLDRKINELKETTGNTDFSQGVASAGVTSGAAIAALQEAGSKTSRDMLKNSYNRYKKMLEMVVDVIRQYYNTDRYFRIKGKNGEFEYTQFSNSQMIPQTTDNINYRVPIFDIQLKAQKASPFSTVAQNEMMKEFYKGGVFRPDMADQSLAMLEGMDFEGKDQIVQRISQNGIMFQQLQQCLMKIQQLEAMLMGTVSQNIKNETQNNPPQNSALTQQGKSLHINNLGDARQVQDYQAQNAAEKTKNSTKVN